MNNKRNIAITGLGLYTSLGTNVQENWQQLVHGKSGVRKITRFSTNGLKTHIGACVSLNDWPRKVMSLLLEQTLAEGILQSQLSTTQLQNAQLFVAAPQLEHTWMQRQFIFENYFNKTHSRFDWEKLSQQLDATSVFYEARHNEAFLNSAQLQYGFQHVPFIMNTACASGATAIQLAAEAIRLGMVEIAIVAGIDASLAPENVVRFSLLSTLSTANDIPEAAAKPFAGNRDGFVLGEGAGVLVLESLAHANARNANILAYLTGCGDTTDNFHRTRSNPSGETIVKCMNKALVDAQLSPHQVDYINAHGTGTRENDKMEALAITRLFDDHCQTLRVSSNKSMLGHTLSAAGAIEAVISVLTLQHQTLPPTINYHEPDPTISLDVVPNQAEAYPVKTIVSNSFGFGGQNVSLVFRRLA